MNRDDSSYSRLFLSLSVLFVTCLLVSNVIAGRLVSVAGVVLPSAVILFPITYILGDVFTEVYGFRKTRLIIWGGFAANLLMSLIFLAAVALPAPSFFKDREAYEKVLGMTPRIVLASLMAYLAGEFANSIVLSLLKKTTKGKFLWLRTIGSTMAGQALDTALFIAIGFFGSVPLAVLLHMMLAQYLFKVGYEVLFTPLTYLAVRGVKKHENIDIYDTGITYNPFEFGEKQ